MLILKLKKKHKIKTDFIQLRSVVPLIILLLFEMVQNIEFLIREIYFF